MQVKGDCSTLLRFLGYCKSKHSGTVQNYNFDIFREQCALSLVDHFCQWLIDTRGSEYSSFGPPMIRFPGVQFGSVANYANSLLGCCQYAFSGVEVETNHVVLEGLVRLRSQAEKEARENRSMNPPIDHNLLVCILDAGYTANAIHLGSVGRTHKSAVSVPSNV